MSHIAALFLLLSSQFIQLKVLTASLCPEGDPPSFMSDGQPQRALLVDDGDTLVLPCGVTGTPTPTVSWFRNGTQIDQTSIMADGTLSIRVTEAEIPREGTNYYCVATNIIGPGNSTVTALRSRDANVSISFFGGFESREVEVPTIEFGSVALECAFNPSNPSPSVAWFADGVMITTTSRIRFLEGGRYLYIQRLTAAERLMRYHCEVNNFLQNGMPFTAPNNYSLNTDIPEESIYVYIRQITRVGESAEFTFVTAIRGSNNTRVPVTILCFSREGLVTFGSPTKATIQATLTEAGRNQDQVNFSCQIGSLLLKGLEDAVGTLIVPGPADISNPIAGAASLTDRDRLVGGGPVEYSCVASGRPAPTITWYYNGAVVQSDSDGVVVGGDGTLTISAPQVSHSGIYQCFARNQFGEDSRTWTLVVTNPVIMVVLDSTFEIMKTGQVNLLLANETTTDLTITAIVNSTTIRNVATCDSCPQVQWKFNNTNITNGSFYIVSNPCGDDFTSPYEFNLTIASLTNETSGEYFAVFTLLSVSTESTRLFVRPPGRPKIISITGAESAVNVEDNLELLCNFVEISRSVTWSKDGINLTNTSRISIIRVMNSVYALRIISVTQEDAGVYACTTVNEAGQDRKAVTVEVFQLNIGSIVLGGVGGILIATGVAIVL